MPIEKGGREPKLTSTAELAMRIVANRRGCADLISPRSQVRGKTSTPLALAQHLAQRADARILITNVESQRSAGVLGTVAQAYTPIIIDGSESSPLPFLPGPLWEEALRTLGLDAGDDRTQ